MPYRANDVVITGRGVLSALADDPAHLHQALCQGESALRPVERFATADTSLPAGEIAFDPRAYLPEGNLRPLDRTGQLVIATAKLALEDAGWPGRDPDASSLPAPDLGLVLGTMYGSVHTIAAFDQRALEAGPKYVKPFDFANSVINAAAGQAAIWHGLRGVNSTVTGGTTAGLQALAYAADTIRQGRADALLAGGAEELCFESFSAFIQAGLLAGCRNGGPPTPRPFDRERNGFALGEGAALLLLESAASAQRRGATILGRIRGHAQLFDVSRGSDVASAAQGLSRTIDLALDEAEVERSDLQAVVASANGSNDGDRIEATALAQAVGLTTPVTSAKGQLGETLGASGGLQALLLLESLRRQQLPGIPNLDVGPDEPTLGLAREPRTLASDAETSTGLATALGLDGNLCALILEGAHDHV